MSEKDPFRLKELGDIERDRGKPMAALQFYLEATAIRPQFVSAHCEQGRILVDLGNFLEAANAFALAWVHSGCGGAFGLACGRALTDAGLSFEACRVFERIDPEDFDAVNVRYHADALRLELRIREALELVPKFRDLTTPWALRTLGDIYCEMGWVDKAQPLLENSLVDDHPFSYDKLVSVHYTTGDYGALRSLLERATSRLSDNEYYPAALEALNIVERDPCEVDVSAFGSWKGHVDCALYFKEHIKAGTRLTGCTYHTFDVVKDIVPEQGGILEFGVRNGHSIHYIAEMFPHRRVHGFDSFEGLPEAWNDLPAGMYSAGGRIPRVPKNVEFVVGWFEETLPRFLKKFQEPIAFMNIDCDIYSATAIIFENLGHLIVPGTVIVFDEYAGHASWREDEFKAFQEWVSRTGVKYRYIAMSFYSKQAAIQILER